MDELSVYLPQDRRLALANGEALPELTIGAALFADISGFTSLTEEIMRSLGERRGIEELTLRINAVYDALISQVEEFGGSVIGFAGDAITCWFDASTAMPSARAALCAQSMQAIMREFPDLSLKVSVSSGPARRFATGDPAIQLIDALAGAPVARLGAANHVARAGEVILDEFTSTLLGLPGDASRTAETGQHYYVLDPSFTSMVAPVTRDQGAQQLHPQLDPTLLKPWIKREFFDGGAAGERLLLTELRPGTALFMRFMGIDYDNDDQARQKLDTVVSQTQRIIERHEGILLDLSIGDKGSYALAAFGALHVHEDDPRRAVRAALEMRELLNGLDFLESIQFGLSCGTMLVGAYGGKTRRAFGVMGYDVNLAARLMTTAAPGEVLVSPRVRKACGEEFVFEARSPVWLKGKAEPLPVFAILGLEQHRPIRLQEPAYGLPIVGRRHEIDVIEEKLALALGGRGQIVGITAAAGLGKSRLVAEGIRLARRRKMIGFGGTCRSEGINTPYLVWQEIWRAFFEVDPTRSVRKQIRSLEAELHERTPEQVNALPLMGTVLGLTLPENDFTRALQPKDRKAQLEGVLAECLRSAAREAEEDGGGLLFVLEDLHLIDPVSLDLLEIAGRAIEKLPVLILVTYRPPDTRPLDQAAARLQALDHFTQLKLTELNAEETEQAIRAKLSQLFPERGGAVPALLIERITNRAQGNPFYVEELLNYLHDRGIDPRDAAALNELELPASLYSLILSRIDQLTASQQRSLKVASIIGRIFRFVDLYSYYPALGTPEDVRTDLQELARLDLTPLESAEPELTYLFKHLVTHEVAYESQAFFTRAQLHAEYALYLENAYPDRIDQFVPQLAHHFEKARNKEKARIYLLKAGEQAAGNYANHEALAYFNRALDLTPETNRQARFDILWNRERVLDLLGKRPEQRRDLMELTHLTDQVENTSLVRAQIATRLVQLEIDVGDYGAAKASADACIREMETNVPVQAQAQELLVDAHLLVARAMFLLGETTAAGQQLNASLSLAREYHYIRGEYNALAHLGTLNWSTGNYAMATGLLEEALDLARHAGNTRRELDILNNLGIVSQARARYSEAIAFYEQAQKIARKIGDRAGEATPVNNMGSASLASGDFVQAGLYSEQAAAMAAEVNDRTLQGIALTNRGEAYREMGQYALANAAGAQALTLVRSSGYRRGECIVLDNIGLIEFSLGNHAKALEATEAAIAVAHEIGSRPTEASALTHLGRIWTAVGEFEKAEQSLMAGKSIAESLGDSSHMLEVQAALAEMALARGGREDGAMAFSCLEGLLNEILKEPPTGQSHLLPLWVYLTCLRVIRSRSDPREVQLIARAEAELRVRSEKIPDPALRITYLNVPEHRAIVTFATAPQ